MLQHSFENVREQLLRAGIAPRHVSRYVVELREHLTDLIARERATGLDARAAEAKARTILGSDSQLAQAMIDRGAPRALAVKAPWAVFGLLPVVAIVAISWIVAMAMFNLMVPVRSLMPAEMPAGYQALIAMAKIFTGYVVGPLSAAACIAIALRQRLSSGWVWLGLALVAQFSSIFAFHAPTASDPMYRATALVMTDAHVINAAATLQLLTLRALVLFSLSALAWRVLKARQAATAS
jgi:hypothetical protein